MHLAGYAYWALFSSLSPACLGGAHYWAPAFGPHTCSDCHYLLLFSPVSSATI